MVLASRLGMDLMLLAFDRLGISDRTVNLTSITLFLGFAVGMVFLGLYPAWYLWLLICSRLFSRRVMEHVSFKGGGKLSQQTLDRWFPASADDPPERPQTQYAWQQASWRPYTAQRPRSGADPSSLESHLGSRLIVVGVCIAVGIGMVWLATGIWRLQGEVATWPTTRGVVLSTRIERIDGGRRDAYDYIPYVKYYYYVEGVRYQSDTYRARPRSVERRDQAEAITGSFRAGRTTTVIYNPQNPQEAFLAPPIATPNDLVWAIYAMICFGAALWQTHEYFSDKWYYGIRPHEWDGKAY